MRQTTGFRQKDVQWPRWRPLCRSWQGTTLCRLTPSYPMAAFGRWAPLQFCATKGFGSQCELICTDTSASLCFAANVQTQNKRSAKSSLRRTTLLHAIIVIHPFELRNDLGRLSVPIREKRACFALRPHEHPEASRRNTLVCRTRRSRFVLMGPTVLRWLF